MTRRLISSGSPFEEVAGYSRAVQQDPWVFVSGTTGFDYRTMTIADGVAKLDGLSDVMYNEMVQFPGGAIGIAQLVDERVGAGEVGVGRVAQGAIGIDGDRAV